MGVRRVNRFVDRSKSTDPVQRQHSGVNVKPILDTQTGFICHPRGFPLEIRKKWFGGLLSVSKIESARIGIMFDSSEYLRPGTIIELVIPVQTRLEKFTGTVVFVRSHAEHYEIGLWLSQGDDASRIRIVEQLCHIEAYMKEKKYREGPYNLNPERVASEWIAKYAAGVPSLEDADNQAR